jgi:hypothetical protein
VEKPMENAGIRVANLENWWWYIVVLHLETVLQTNGKSGVVNGHKQMKSNEHMDEKNQII